MVKKQERSEFVPRSRELENFLKDSKNFSKISKRFSKKNRKIFLKGSENLLKRLWNNFENN